MLISATLKPARALPSSGQSLPGNHDLPSFRTPAPTKGLKVTIQAPAAVEITGIACVYLPVLDVYASAQWYMKNLGLEVSPHTPLVPEMGHAMLTYPSRGPSLFLL